MNITRKQLTQIGISIFVILMIAALIAFGGSWAVEAIKEMHGM